MNLPQTGERYDVVVIGAGPAGAMAAREAARHGASVLLVDKAAFPRTKVCGCCLNRDALATLTRVGLGELPRRLGAIPLHAMRLAAGDHEARLTLRGSVSLSRYAMDAALVSAACEAGAVLLDDTRATLIDRVDNHHHRLSLQRGNTRHEIFTRTLAVADGVGGRFLDAHPAFHTHITRGSRIGIGTVLPTGPSTYEPGVIHMACGRGGYVGLVRLETGELDIAAAFDPHFVKHAGGPARAVRTCLQEAGWSGIDADANETWKGTALLTRRRRPLAHAGIVLLGDAAGYVEPFTGEGIGWALACGEAVGALLGRASRMHTSQSWNESLARAWMRCYRRLVARRQMRCRAIAMVLRRPRVVRMGVRLLGRCPGVVRPVVEAVTAPTGAP